MDSARHVIKRNVNPRFLGLLASYDVASTIRHGAHTSLNALRILLCWVKRHPLSWQALSISPCHKLVACFERVAISSPRSHHHSPARNHRRCVIWMSGTGWIG